MSNINYTYTNLTPFKWYVLENFPFIEADFDALTNWQLFCKLGKEINKIIDSVNTSGEQVETLTNAFNNLQNYVNNYFDNLDVQEEINNKLDQMAQDGTLEGLLNKILNMYVNYEQFGAKGDGVTNDFQAILDAHMYANEHNLPIKTNPEKTYLIKEITEPIQIKTNVDWNESKFIIDDRNLSQEQMQLYIFEIKTPYEEKALTKLLKTDTSIPGINKEYFTFITDTNTRIYYDKNNSSLPLRDTLLINSLGEIETPILYDFENINANHFYELRKNPLIIKGGYFTTIRANNKATISNYVRRSISVNTNNVIFENISHEMQENSEGILSVYGGFFNLIECYNIHFKNIKLANYNSGGSSSYEIQMDLCQNIYFDNVYVDDLTKDNNWGVIGSNAIKEIYFNNCKLNRIDSHTQASNIYIDNCIIGVKAIQINGYNDLVITNSIFLSNYFINLRPDRGSSWDGNIIIKDSRLECLGGTTDYIALIRSSDDGTFNFGYQTILPNITLENVYINDEKLSNLDNGISIISNSFIELTAQYKPLFKEFIKAKNVISKMNNTIFPFYVAGANIFSKGKSNLSGQTTLPSDDYRRESRLKYITNYLIEMDNCSIKTSNTMQWNLCISNLVPNAETIGNTIINNPTYNFLIPKVIIKNNNNVVAYPTKLPCIIEFINCTIKYIYNYYSGCISKIYYDNCTFYVHDWLHLNNDSIVRCVDTPVDMTTYKDCYFAKTSLIDDSTKLKTAFPLFNAVKYDGHNIFAYNKFDNCEIWDKTIFDWLPTNYEELYSIEILNSISKQERNSLKIGSTEERPYNPNEGTIYFDTTLNKFIVYNNSNWIIP